MHVSYVCTVYYVREIDKQKERGGAQAVPVVDADRERWRVLSRRYEAYVRDQREITEMRGEEWAVGAERQITRGFMP